MREVLRRHFLIVKQQQREVVAPRAIERRKAGAAATAGKNAAMEGDSDRLPSPPLLRLPFSAWQGGGRGGARMRSEGNVDLWRIRRTVVASLEMQTPRTPSPVLRAGDNDSFTGTGERGKEGGGEDGGKGRT